MHMFACVRASGCTSIKVRMSSSLHSHRRHRRHLHHSQRPPLSTNTTHPITTTTPHHQHHHTSTTTTTTITTTTTTTHPPTHPPAAHPPAATTTVHSRAMVGGDTRRTEPIRISSESLLSPAPHVTAGLTGFAPSAVTDTRGGRTRATTRTRPSTAGLPSLDWRLSALCSDDCRCDDLCDDRAAVEVSRPIGSCAPPCASVRSRLEGRDGGGAAAADGGTAG
jgi:hypothetical protein